MHKTGRSPCELSHILHNTDVLLTPHGFQSMLLLFLPRPAVIFEVFPYRYYKRGYGPFGHEYGELELALKFDFGFDASLRGSCKKDFASSPVTS
jgi:hypothetical protein